MISPRLFTTMVFDPKKDPFQAKHYDLFYKCFQSWHRLMPDYDIRIISLANVLEYGSDEWVQERMREGNYLAVSHWARLTWLLQAGGVYVDMDIEAVQRFDAIRECSFFAGHEGGDQCVNNAIMGAEPGHSFVRDMLDYTMSFPLSHPQWPNETGPRMNAMLARANGWTGKNKTETLRNGATIYNSKYFYPYFWNETFTPECVTPVTHAIHHWASTWNNAPPPKAHQEENDVEVTLQRAETVGVNGKTYLVPAGTSRVPTRVRSLLVSIGKA